MEIRSLPCSELQLLPKFLVRHNDPPKVITLPISQYEPSFFRSLALNLQVIVLYQPLHSSLILDLLDVMLILVHIIEK